MEHRVFLGLGSNLGNGERNLQEAIRQLQQRVGRLLAQSAMMKSEPWGFESEHIFTNAVVAMSTSLDPETLLDVTQQIEHDMGRRHKHRPGEAYTDRIIDIDLLTYDNLQMENERLTLPHPHIEERDFVRIPMQEVEQMLGK